MHRRTIQKDLNDPDDHGSVLTQIELDILECEVKWAFGSVTTNKASGGDGIPAELFQILKDDAVTVLQSMCQQTWKTSSGHRTAKGQFSFQYKRKAMLKNVQTRTQLHSFQSCTHFTYLHAVFNLHAEYIMQNTGLDETQAGIKISGRNTNNLRYADDTTLMAGSKEELNSLLLKVKGE